MLSNLKTVLESAIANAADAAQKGHGEMAAHWLHVARQAEQLSRELA